MKMKEEKEKEQFYRKIMRKVSDRVNGIFPFAYEEMDYSFLAYLEEEKHPCSLLNITDIMAKMGVDLETREYVYDRAANLRDEWRYGCRIFYDPESRCVKAEDAHEAEVKVVAEHNRPVAYITLCGRSGSFRMPAKDLDGFLFDRDIPENAVRVDPDSIDRYYSFYGSKVNRWGEAVREDFVRQTKAIRESRRNSPYADLWRMDVNKASYDNDFGLTFTVFEDHLVEDCGGIFLSELMDKDDYKLAVSPYDPDSFWTKEITRIYQARQNSKVVDEARDRFTKARDVMQKAVDAHKDDICGYLLQRLNVPVGDKPYEQAKNLDEAKLCPGLDCGWVYFVPKSAALMKDVKNAALDDKEYNAHSDGTFNLQLPYEPQSTTIKAIEAEKVEEIVQVETGIELSHRVQLD